MRRAFNMVCVLAVAAALVCEQALAAPTVRIKDIATVKGVRANQLVGFGLVVGLNGTGDDDDAIVHVLENMFKKLRVAIPQNAFDPENAAAVMVTTDLPPFVKCGQRIDVVVASTGNADTLEGGILLQTPLQGADGEVYAVAQGGVSTGGYSVRGQTARVMKNHPTVARVPNGALIEKEVPASVLQGSYIHVMLAEADFTSAVRLAEAVNEQFKATGEPTASVVDPTTIQVSVPKEFVGQDGAMRFISQLEHLQLEPDAPARVVINERTGTIVAGENVRMSTVAVSHGPIYITIQEQKKVSQPGAFSGGETKVTTETDIRATEGEGSIQVLPAGVTIDEVAQGLNLLGASPRDIIAIFQAIKRAGALQAELIIM